MREWRMAVKPEHDAYGQELWNCHRGSTDWEIIERDDGLVACESARQYFHAYKDWPIHEREGLKRVRGRVLDIGAGAGRVALELQQRGMDVLAIDNSPLAIKTAKVRGVKRARVLAIEEIGALRGRFDTIVMYGNNFALFGGLRTFHVAEFCDELARGVDDEIPHNRATTQITKEKDQNEILALLFVIGWLRLPGCFHARLWGASQSAHGCVRHRR